MEFFLFASPSVSCIYYLPVLHKTKLGKIKLRDVNSQKNIIYANHTVIRRLGQTPVAAFQ